MQDIPGAIDFQTDLMVDLSKEAEYGYDVDARAIFYTWEKHRIEDIATYRNGSFSSSYTGTKSPVPHTPFMKAMNDSMDNILKE